MWHLSAPSSQSSACDCYTLYLFAEGSEDMLRQFLDSPDRLQDKHSCAGPGRFANHKQQNLLVFPPESGRSLCVCEESDTLAPLWSHSWDTECLLEHWLNSMLLKNASNHHLFGKADHDMNCCTKHGPSYPEFDFWWWLVAETGNCRVDTCKIKFSYSSSSWGQTLNCPT